MRRGGASLVNVFKVLLPFVDTSYVTPDSIPTSVTIVTQVMLDGVLICSSDQLNMADGGSEHKSSYRLQANETNDQESSLDIGTC